MNLRAGSLRALRQLCVALLALALVLQPDEGAFSDQYPDAFYAKAYFGEPIEGVTRDQLQSFERGFRLFVRNWSEGAGFARNGDSCVACHSVPMPGGSGMSDQALVAIDISKAHGSREEIVQRFSGTTGSPHPNLMTTTVRRSPALFGLGYIEAVEPQTEDGGRFGTYLQAADLDDFVALAFATELGVSSRQYCARTTSGKPYPTKCGRSIGTDQVRDVANFLRMLAPPLARMSERHMEGRRLFGQAKCDTCHRPTLVTGTGAVPALSNRTIHAYTDLKRHRLGSDERSSVRTAPLWGVNSFGPPYMHNACANSLAEAIACHSGVAADSAAAFESLQESEKAALIEFLKAL